jgi:hypothetical protein
LEKKVHKQKLVNKMCGNQDLGEATEKALLLLGASGSRL